MKTIDDNEMIETSRGRKRIGALFDENAMLRAEVELFRKLVDLLADDLHLIELGYVLAEASTPANLRRAILAAKPDIATARAALNGGGK